MRLRPILFSVLAVLIVFVGVAIVFARNYSQVPVKTLPNGTITPVTEGERCPQSLADKPNCFAPRVLRELYGVQALTDKGFTGKGQTVITIVSYGSPTLQQDLKVYDQYFGLPDADVQVLAPLGTVPFNPNDREMIGWAAETELDVEMVHVIAPEARIVVLTSPVAETQGTIGLPEFRKLEEYALEHHLGQIISQSWAASEATLQDQKGREELQRWDTFFHNATTQQGISFFAGSGDNGATDAAQIEGDLLADKPTVNFPADNPWVTAVGGTVLSNNNNVRQEIVWPGSGGGVSTLYPMPSYQQSLPTAIQGSLHNQRGLPDIAASASRGLALYIDGTWRQIGGTSASTPFWAGLTAIANQMTGHPLGFLNPALYKLAQSPRYQQDFHDITIGNNDAKIDRDGNSIVVTGFAATAGWDAVTGWGSPDAEKLLPDLIAAMQS